MRTKRGLWCVGVVAVLVCCAGTAIAKPEKEARGDRGEKPAKMTAVKREGAEPMKVVKEISNSRGASKSVEVSREKNEGGVETKRHTTTTTANGVTVVRDDTRTREREETGKASLVHSGTTVVTNAHGESKTSSRKSSLSRDGKSVTRMSGMTGPGGRTRSATTMVVKSDGGATVKSDVARRNGSTVQRETTRTVERSNGKEPAKVVEVDKADTSG
ncbi:MAG: hypothetical protein ACK5ZG_07265 [Phycisphaerae bacterium]|jgi:hypothetical protein